MTREVYIDEFGSLVVPIEKLAKLGGVKTANDCGNSVRDALKELSDALNRSGKNVDVHVRKVCVQQLRDASPKFAYYVTAETIEPIVL